MGADVDVLDWNQAGYLNGEMDAALISADRQSSFPGTATNPCSVAVKSGEGAWITDHAGRRYLDLYGNNCHHIGYRHPRLTAALHDQLDRLSFTPRGLTNAPAVAFATSLVNRVGWLDAKVVTARSGADAIEIALAIARVATGRYKTISFYDAYHGRSAGALSLGGRYADHHGLGPLLPGALHVAPYHRFGEAALGFEHDAYARHSLDAMRICFEQERDIAAVVGETVRNGPYTPPNWYWPEVRRLCDAYGALLILDEIATGLGKTGVMFNYSRYDVKPDILVLGKALGGTAMPLSAVVADGRLNSSPQLNIGYFTNEKNPLCAKAGETTLAILEDDRLPDRAAAFEASLRTSLEMIKEKRREIVEVRVAGLMAALDFAGDAAVAAKRATAVHKECISRGLLPMPPRGRTLSFSAPLIVEAGELEGALQELEAALATTV